MGSQRRRTDKSGGGGRRTGGGGGGEGTGGEERPDTSRDRNANRVYQKATKIMDASLKSRNYLHAAEIASKIAISETSVHDAMVLFLAGAKAFDEGRGGDWKKKLSELTNDGIQYAQQKTGYELTQQNRQLLNNVLISNLEKVAEKHRRK